MEGAARLASVDWTGWTTRFVLFTGKGGVGKTTIASAVAVALAETGRRVLLVSTDPASNLADVFRMDTDEDPRPVPLVAGLDVMDLDPRAAADTFRDRVVEMSRGVLTASQLGAMETALGGACTVEVATFDAFARLLADPAVTVGYEHVVFDTAPTGHTLRLLGLPAAWSRYLAGSPQADGCLGPRAGLQEAHPMYAAAAAALVDPARTTLVLVTRPEPGPVEVAAEAASELRDCGFVNQRLVINGVLTRPEPGDPVAESLGAVQRRVLRSLPAPIDRLASCVVPLVAQDLVGVDAIRSLVTARAASAPPASPSRAASGVLPGGDLTELVDRLEEPGHGVVLVTGKGGVGKTTVARRVAIELARRGNPVHLTTTDPAGHEPATVGTLPRLTTSAVEPGEATRRYVQERLDAAARRGIDDDHLELLADDLRSPCTQEVAVFRAFHRLLRRARQEFVVIDAAPTGHTLLLLDTTGAFHRQVTQDLANLDGRALTPLMRLQDRGSSRTLIVTSAETTPVAEASTLQEELRRAGIEPFGWVVNATMSGTGTTDPVLAARAARERAQMTRIAALAPRLWVLPWDAALAGIPDRHVARAG